VGAFKSEVAVMFKVAFYTLGCKVNTYETEALWQLFLNAGYQRVQQEEVADVYVINTCAVTHAGEQKSRQIIRRLVRRAPHAVVVVTGCYAQTAPAVVADIPGVDIVVGTSGRKQLLGLVAAVQRTRNPIIAVEDLWRVKPIYEELGILTSSCRTRALVKIQEGCNNFCTFCIIPWAKGRSRSRKPELVIEEAQRLIALGYKELVLTGIHTGGYGEDLPNYSFVKLIEELQGLSGDFRLRISSLEVTQVNAPLIAILKQIGSKICPHLHLPLQAGSDPVLKRMGRHYNTKKYQNIVCALRVHLPDLAITTDVITGFPGETDEQFQEGYELMKRLKLGQLHVFPYSKRSGTRAAQFEDQISEEVKRARAKKLLELSEQLQTSYAKQFIGQALRVLPESEYKNAKYQGYLTGFSDNYLRIVFKGPQELKGKFCNVLVKKIQGHVCLGELVEDKAISKF
jgi:threonylcarbamoyladenosine tRNA methylthiotransferase MtaB